MSMRWAWTGPAALAHYAATGWDTCPALLAVPALLALKLLLNKTQISACRSYYKLPGQSS